MLPATTHSSQDSFTEARLAQLQGALAPHRQALIQHRIYAELNSQARLRQFMEHHVFAVWDFMSLLKWLQRELTCVDLPWRPRGDRLTRRLINEIVLGEESDVDGTGGYSSHFEMYLEAMEQCEADVGPVLGLVERLTTGTPVEVAIVHSDIPAPAQAFMRSTFALLATESPHQIAAAFALGREDLIPDMFRAIVEDVHARVPGQWSRLLTYLERHIELDGDEHTPLALRMLATLCGEEEQRWQEATTAATRSLQARKALWDGVLAEFSKG